MNKEQYDKVKTRLEAYAFKYGMNSQLQIDEQGNVQMISLKHAGLVIPVAEWAQQYSDVCNVLQHFTDLENEKQGPLIVTG